MSNLTDPGVVGPPPPPVFLPPPLPDPLPMDRSYQADVIACSVIMTVFGTLCVIARFYTRRVLLNVLGWEDWFILLAQIFSILTCAAQIYQAVLGLGLHWWLLQPENIIPMAKAGWFCVLAYQLSLGFSQVSIMMLYLRIWTYPWIRRVAWVLLVLLLLYLAFDLSIVFTNCIPLQSTWDFSMQGFCHSKTPWWIITGLHIVFDFMLFSLPIPVIFTMTCGRRQKILLYLLFSFGFFICLISIIRLVWVFKTANATDVPFEYVPIATWTAIETNGAVAVACLMTLKPLLSKFFPRLMSSTLPRSSDEEPANGRVLTIGSRPLRPGWNVFHSRHGGLTQQGLDDANDLEAQVGEKGRQPLESGTTLDGEAEADAKLDVKTQCSDDTVVVQKD